DYREDFWAERHPVVPGADLNCLDIGAEFDTTAPIDHHIVAGVHDRFRDLGREPGPMCTAERLNVIEAGAVVAMAPAGGHEPHPHKRIAVVQRFANRRSEQDGPFDHLGIAMSQFARVDSAKTVPKHNNFSAIGIKRGLERSGYSPHSLAGAVDIDPDAREPNSMADAA